MGCLCPPAEKEELPQQRPTNTRPPDSERGLTVTSAQQKPNDQSSSKRDSNIDLQSSPSVRQTAKLWKTKSTALFSSNQGSVCSVMQLTIDHGSMIVKDNEVKDNQTGDFYMIAEKVAFLRKTGDRLKVTTPDGQSEINCAPAHLYSVLTISEGKPADCLEEVGMNRYIMNDQSPVQLKLKLKCEACKKLMKVSYCVSMVKIRDICCGNCQKTGNWSIQDIQSNFVVWGGGEKIHNHERVEPAPNVVRVMGCVCCFRFSNCKKMQCGCRLCRDCIQNQKITVQEECWMCQDRSFILPS